MKLSWNIDWTPAQIFQLPNSVYTIYNTAKGVITRSNIYKAFI